jgi:L-arabinonolactonase
MLSIEWLGEQRDRLGECPLWDDRRQQLFWIDSKNRRVQSLEPVSGRRRHWILPEEVGSLALCESGRMLVALERQIGFLELDTGRYEPLTLVSHPQERMRLNDGRADRQGRFLVGSLQLAPASPVGELHQLEPSGQMRVVESGVRVSNTLALSPNGDALYFADSLSHQIRRYDYEPATGQLGAMHVFADTHPLGSGPDGAAVDSQGHLWVALVMKGQLARFRPDGSLERLVDLPTPYPSCLCFGGPQLDVIYVTSLSDTGNTIKTEDPRAGRLLAVHGTGVRGLPESRFADNLTSAAR